MTPDLMSLEELSEQQLAKILLIPLRRRDGLVRDYAMIDRADAQLAEHRWYLGTRGYALRQVKIPGRNSSRAVFMHREVLGLVQGDGRQADHVNRDKLDNRRMNLRVVTCGENQQNRVGTRALSGVRGVHWIGNRGKWAARVKVNGRMVVRGYFDTVEEAAVVAERLRAELHPYAP